MKRNLLTKTRLKPLLQRDKTKPLKYLTFEIIGNILIYLSGVLPFIHVLIDNKKLEEKFFGFSSIHKFAYSLGTHASLFFLVLGLLILIPILDKENVDFYKKSLKYSLLSPFISAVFFMVWVFIPGVNFNLLAYSFIALCISALVFYLTLQLVNYIQLLKTVFIYKEKLLSDGIDFIDSKLNNTGDVK